MENNNIPINRIISILVAIVVTVCVLVPICSQLGNGGGSNGGNGDGPLGEMNPGVPIRMITSDYSDTVQLSDYEGITEPEFVLITPFISIMAVPLMEYQEFFGAPSIFLLNKYNCNYGSNLAGSIVTASYSLGMEYDGTTLTLNCEQILPFPGEEAETEMFVGATESMVVDWIAIPDENGTWAISKANGKYPGEPGEMEPTDMVYNPIEYPVEIHYDNISDIWVSVDNYPGWGTIDEDFYTFAWNNGEDYYIPITVSIPGMDINNEVANKDHDPYELLINLNESNGVINTGNIEVSYPDLVSPYYGVRNGYVNHVVYPRYYGGVDALSDDNDSDSGTDTGIAGTIFEILPVFVLLAILGSIAFMFTNWKESK